MRGMRGLAAAGLAALVLSTAACGGSSLSATATAGAEAAGLVPPDALALLSINTDLDAEQWQRLDELTSGLDARARIRRMVREALAKKQLDLERDVRPALGSELDLAVLGIENGKPEVIALARPEDEAKLRALASRFDEGGDHYTVEPVGDWSVVAESPEDIAAVRRAETATSLADSARFREAQRELPDDAVARVFVSHEALRVLPSGVRELLGMVGRDWIAAAAAAEDGALQVSVAARNGALPDRSLIDDVPSGASLALAFDAARIPFGPYMPSKAGALEGPAVLYVGSGGLIPTIALELRPSDPDEALAVLRMFAEALRRRSTIPIPLVVERHGDRVFAADSVGAVKDLLGSGPKLVDDSAFKDAVDAAGGGEAFLYADFERLAPVLQVAGQLLPRLLPPELVRDLDRVGTVVGVARAEGGIHRFELRIRRR
jgi:hypothetical protein